MLSRSREEIKREIFELRLELDKKGFSQKIADRIKNLEKELD